MACLHSLTLQGPFNTRRCKHGVTTCNLCIPLQLHKLYVVMPCLHTSTLLGVCHIYWTSDWYFLMKPAWGKSVNYVMPSSWSSVIFILLWDLTLKQWACYDRNIAKFSNISELTLATTLHLEIDSNFARGACRMLSLHLVLIYKTIFKQFTGLLRKTDNVGNTASVKFNVATFL